MVRYKLHVYKSDCVLKRQYKHRTTPPDSTRGDIEYWSGKSRRRLAFVASNTGVEFKTMVTLTYPATYANDGKQIKRDLRVFIQWLRDVATECEYLWFLEFQRRGAPHYHILLNRALSALPPKKAISRRWYDIVASGDERHLLAGTRTESLRSSEGGKRYAVKYAMKMQQKKVPEDYQNVGRFWGHSDGVKPVRQEVRHYETMAELEKSLKDWRYKKHLRNYKVSTLFNAAKELGR